MVYTKLFQRSTHCGYFTRYMSQSLTQRTSWVRWLTHWLFYQVHVTVSHTEDHLGQMVNRLWLFYQVHVTVSHREDHLGQMVNTLVILSGTRHSLSHRGPLGSDG